MSIRELGTEITLAVAFVTLLALLLNPFGFLMSDSVEYMFIAGFAIVMAVFLALVWREQARDEREQLHRFVASRAAYLLGSATLALAIVIEKITLGMADVWLVVALSVMVLAKLAGLLYSRIHH